MLNNKLVLWFWPNLHYIYKLNVSQSLPLRSYAEYSRSSSSTAFRAVQAFLSLNKGLCFA